LSVEEHEPPLVPLRERLHVGLKETPKAAFHGEVLETRPDAYRDVVRAFGEVAAALGELRALDDLLHLIASKICKLTNVRRCSVYLRDDETGLYRGQVGHWHHDIDERVKRLVAGIESDGFTREIVETRAPVVVSDSSLDPRPIKSTMREWHVRSMLGVPMVLRDEVIGIVFLDDEERPRTYTNGDAQIASAFADLAAVAISQAQLTSDLRDRLTTVATQNRTLRRASAVEDRLTALALEGRSTEEIATAVAELTGKPVAVHDAQHGMIAAASPPASDEAVLPRLLDPVVRAHPEVADALVALESPRPAVVAPIPSAGLHHRTLAVPITVRGDRWGTLIIAEYRSRFGRFDMIIGRRAATILALEMTAERRATAAEWNARSALAADLVRDGRDLADIEHRADYLGVRLRAPHLVALVTGPRDAGGAQLNPARVAARVRGVAGDELQVLATGVEEGVMVMLELAAPGSASEEWDGARAVIAQALETFDESGELRVGVSLPCAKPADVLRAYKEARQALQCLQTFGDGEIRLLGADELGPARVFLATADPEQVRSFASATLGPLLDRRTPGELLHTLQAFLEGGWNVRRSAMALDVHENTIRYRLARIEELTGLALVSDSNDQLSAQLAMLVVRLQGKLAA
jgi:sugar diacid utilization regulator